ncbi:hypothetical protein AALO_G00275920 [Alosa alosa]|uniref:LITAF domain-containing protein n=1 Tax=Alosa alosa TaxID=278164 RepID=A0AAV6FQ63_9TELE|nr:lipopolysaccharide-induced tumor necrosis factor-alpha factor homolog [Alosa alosa]KAG5262511.1 hypothetical protein AALO_G00275920 [Alosa alosa]
MSGEELERDQSSKALWLMAFRKQQLQHRRGLLVKAREFSSAPPEESINTGELDTIEAELKEITRRQTEVLKSGKLQKDPHDVRLFGETIFPEPDYHVPQEMIPEPDYAVLEEPSLKEPSPEANDNMTEPEETEPPESIVQPVVSQDKLLWDPDWVTCSTCSRVVRTVVKHEVTSTSWILCFTLSSIGCVLGCCFIPFCAKRWKDISHYCPKCNAKIHDVLRF